jgi:hypothetical protein
MWWYAGNMGWGMLLLTVSLAMHAKVDDLEKKLYKISV